MTGRNDMITQLSRMTVPNMVDLLGTLNSEKKILAEMESRVKKQLVKKSGGTGKVYGDSYTVNFVPTNSSKFNKEAFIKKYSAKVYDSFVVKSPTTRTDVVSVEEVTKPKDEVTLFMDIAGFGEVAAGSTK